MKAHDLVKLIEKNGWCWVRHEEITYHRGGDGNRLLRIFPDVPGCGSTGKTKEEVARNIQEAIEFHLEGLREEGYEIPEPGSYSAYIEVAA